MDMEAIKNLASSGAASPITAALLAGALAKYAIDLIKMLAAWRNITLPPFAVQALALPVSLVLFYGYTLAAHVAFGDNLAMVLLAALAAVGYNEASGVVADLVKRLRNGAVPPPPANPGAPTAQ